MSRAIIAYSESSYDGFCTSGEVLKAIEEIAGDDVRDNMSAAYKMWEDPSPEQYYKIYTRAWELADKDTEELFWGESGAISRPHWRINN